MNDYINDIPSKTAISAYYGTSFSPEKLGQNCREEYAGALEQIRAEIEAHAKTDADRALVETEFARFREGFKRRYLAYLHSQSRIYSSFIAGPANFPVARMQKRNGIASKRLEEFLNYKHAGKAAIIAKLHPEWRPIMSGDADAVDRLEAKLEAAEKLQDRMKRINATIRKNRKATPERLLEAVMNEGLSEGLARKLLEPSCFGTIGFETFNLTNNGAEIRRIKDRVEALKRAREQVVNIEEGPNARLEVNPAENRIKIFFGGKPPVEVREKLKSNGFRWAPSVGAWQGYCSFSREHTARTLAGIVA